jgi:hypothetical protein
MEGIDLMRRYAIILLFICPVLVSGTLHAVSADPLKDLKIQPAILNIDSFYSGGRVAISGEVPETQDVIVQIAGPATNGAFDIKGRVGPFWMTRGKAELVGAPAMYVLLLPGGEEWQTKASSLGLDLRQIRKKIDLHSTTLPPDKLFDLFIELKKSEGHYAVENNAVSYAPGKNGMRHFTAVYRFPRSTVTGNYDIVATTVSGSGIGMEQSTSFQVKEIGFTRMIDRLATHQRLTYGILAVVIALFTGAVMGVLFKGGGGH